MLVCVEISSSSKSTSGVSNGNSELLAAAADLSVRSAEQLDETPLTKPLSVRHSPALKNMIEMFFFTFWFDLQEMKLMQIHRKKQETQRIHEHQSSYDSTTRLQLQLHLCRSAGVASLAINWIQFQTQMTTATLSSIHNYCTTSTRRSLIFSIIP